VHAGGSQGEAAVQRASCACSGRLVWKHGLPESLRVDNCLQKEQAISAEVLFYEPVPDVRRC
jgi:hypothetical protein